VEDDTDAWEAELRAALADYEEKQPTPTQQEPTKAWDKEVETELKQPESGK
jgi:hypothetical protein